MDGNSLRRGGGCSECKRATGNNLDPLSLTLSTWLSERLTYPGIFTAPTNINAPSLPHSSQIASVIS